MVKRAKRLEKSIGSLKKQIEEHFGKLEEDIKEKDEILAGYHVKEIEKSLIDDLEYKMNLLGKEDKILIKKYKKRLKDLKKKLGHVFF